MVPNPAAQIIPDLPRFHLATLPHGPIQCLLALFLTLQEAPSSPCMLPSPVSGSIVSRRTPGSLDQRMVLGRARTAWSTGCGASTESWNTDKTTYTEIGTLNGSLLLGVAPRSCQLTGQSICSHPGTFEYRVLCNRHRKQKDRTLSSPTPLCSTHHVGVLQREFSPSPGLFLGDRSARCPSLQESPGCPGHIPPYLTLLKRAPPPQAFTEVSSNTAHVCASFRPRLRSVLGFPNLLGHFSDRKPVYQAATRTATCRLLSQPTTSNMLYAVSSETELKPQTFLCPLLQDLIKPVEGPSISGWTRPDRVLSIKYSNTVTGNTQGGE